MRKVIESWDELVGKTVEGVFEDYFTDNVRILTFTDGTCAAIRSELGYENERELPELVPIDPYHESHIARLVQYGIMTAEDQRVSVERKQAAEQQKKAATEERERSEFQRLKAKFERS